MCGVQHKPSQIFFIAKRYSVRLFFERKAILTNFPITVIVFYFTRVSVSSL